MRDQNVPAPVKLSSRPHPCEGPAGRVVTPHLLFQSRPWSSARSGHLAQDRSLRPALLQSSILEFLGQLVAPEITCQSIHLPAESYLRNTGPSEHCIPWATQVPSPSVPEPPGGSVAVQPLSAAWAQEPGSSPLLSSTVSLCPHPGSTSLSINRSNK